MIVNQCPFFLNAVQQALLTWTVHLSYFLTASRTKIYSWFSSRTLLVQYPLWILLLFYTKVSRNSFDSPCPSTEIYEKAPFRGSFLFLCGQGESNSRLILGKDVLYHLTMPAVSVLRQKLWRQYRVLEQIVQLAICHRQNCDTERD